MTLEDKMRSKVKEFEFFKPDETPVIVINYHDADSIELERRINGREYFEGYEVERSLRVAPGVVLCGTPEQVAISMATSNI